MGPASDETTYILLGVDAKGAIPGMELIACRGAEDALARARSWLRAHASFVRVQVWSDSDRLLGEVTPDPGAAQAPTDLPEAS